MIYSSNPGASYTRQSAAIEIAVTRVLKSGQYILGPEVVALEVAMAAANGMAYGVGVASGTDALLLALRALDIGPGDEVITVSHTAVATVAAIVLAGAKPVLVDVDSTYYTIDPTLVTKAITKKTKALIAVHLYGQAADMPALQKIAKAHDLWLLEDCAQAQGGSLRDKPLGSWGDVSCFSFYPTKNVGAFGDGGMVLTKSKKIAQSLRELRQYGWRKRYDSVRVGYNSRLDEIQAAILQIKLADLPWAMKRRHQIAQAYDNALRDTNLGLPAVRPDSIHAWHLFVVRVPKRPAFLKQLAKAGIIAGIHYPVAVHQQPAYRKQLRLGSRLKNTEQLTKDIVSLPLYPEMSDSEVRAVTSAVIESL